MEAPSLPEDHWDAPTSAKLGHDIDRGRGGDKLDVIDLAAAPLGTDDEAAGTPPSREAVQIAYKNEIVSRPSSERAKTDWVVFFFVAFIVGVVSILLLAGLYLPR
jgi:hypothetical protein